MRTEQARILANGETDGGYRLLALRAARIAPLVLPGQFLTLRIPNLDGAVLRRPFSVYRVDGDTVSVLYKCVGRGTRIMAELKAGRHVDVLGPLGRGFPLDREGTRAVLVAGGYGVAPLAFLAGRLAAAGDVFIGGATAADILCSADFEALGWNVHVATEDGSRGVHGLVTDALDAWTAGRDAAGPSPEFYACGPDGLLRAVGERAVAAGSRAWLSMDRHMGCGVGACLACVLRVREENGSEHWARACRDGPVFETRQIVWGPDAERGPNP